MSIVNVPITGRFAYRDAAATPAARQLVTFTPISAAIVDGPLVTLPHKMSFALDDSGAIPPGSTLPTVPGGVFFRVEESFPGGRPSYAIEVLHTDTLIDLVTVAPVVPPPELVSTRGPAGLTGPAGDITPAAAAAAAAADVSAADAVAAAAAAALSEATAESASGPTYISQAAGEAATTAGQSFAVDSGGGVVTIYLRTGGGSTAQRALATTAALAAMGGAGMVGFKPPFPNTYNRNLSAFLTDLGLNVLHFIDPAEHAAIRNGTSTYDCAPGFQKCIDTALYAGGGRGKVWVPSGIYKWYSEVCFGYGNAGYNSLHFEGAGIMFNSETPFNGTAIHVMHANSMGGSIQGLFQPTFKGFSIRGLNHNHIVNNGLATHSGPQNDIDVATWIDPTLPATVDSRFAPYVAFAIDPRSGPSPSTSYGAAQYPDVAYPAEHFPVAPAQYNKYQSINVVFEDVEIDGFIAGLASQPCDYDGNADFTKLNRVLIQRCVYGVSLCNTQARLTHMNDGHIFQCHTGFVTTKHGRQQGKPAILCTSVEMRCIINWVDMPNMANGGSPHFLHCYGELIYRIGNVGASSIGNTPITFDSCEFAFELHDLRGPPAYVFENNGDGMSAFKACAFGSTESTATRHFMFAGAANSYKFEDCSVVNNATEMYEKFALNCTGGISTSALASNYAAFNLALGYRWNLDTGANFVTPNNKISKENIGPRNMGLPHASRVALPASIPAEPGERVSRRVNNFDKAGYVFTTSGRDVTFNTGYAGLEWAHQQRGFGVGDVVWDDASGVVFYIRSRDNATGDVTMRAMTGYTFAGALRTAMTTAGNLYTLNTRVYTPAYPLWGDTPGGATMTNLDDGNGGGGYAAGDIAIGDRFYAGDFIDAFANETVGKVLAIDGVARTLTIDGGFTRIGTHRRVAMLIRAEAPNSP